MEWNRRPGWAKPRGSRCAAGLLLAALGLVLGCRAWVPEFRSFGPGTVEGRVVGDAAGDGAWVVVYLDGSSDRTQEPANAAVLSSGPRGFSPPLLVVAQGQAVEVANGDDIHHRFFSSSRPNDFELPALPGGKSHRISLEHLGVVRVYCSLHPGESGTIFVAPSRHFATVRAPGSYAIPDVAPGRYVLHAWSADAGAPTQEITVRSGESAIAEVALAETRP